MRDASYLVGYWWLYIHSVISVWRWLISFLQMVLFSPLSVHNSNKIWIVLESPNAPMFSSTIAVRCFSGLHPCVPLLLYPVVPQVPVWCRLSLLERVDCPWPHDSVSPWSAGPGWCCWELLCPLLSLSRAGRSIVQNRSL